MTSHGIIATDWMLKKGNELRAIVLPLVPEIETKEDGWKYWNSGVYDATLAWWPDEMPFSYQGSFDQLQYQVGDRVYLQEPSVFHSKSQSVRVRSSFSPEVDDLIDWVPAGFLAEEDSLYRFDITGVKVCQLINLEFDELFNCGLISQRIESNYSSETGWGLTEEAATTWNDIHPRHLWDSDRWVIVLSVEPAKNVEVKC